MCYLGMLMYVYMCYKLFDCKLQSPMMSAAASVVYLSATVVWI